MGPIFESVFQPEDAVKMPGIWAKMHLGGETSPDIWNWVRYEHAGKAFAGMGPPNDGPLVGAGKMGWSDGTREWWQIGVGNLVSPSPFDVAHKKLPF